MDKEYNLTANSPTMPAKVSAGIYDTSEMYKKENVSYGWGHPHTMSDGKSIIFADNELKDSARLDERNLQYCKYLNLYRTSLTRLDCSYLVNLELLVLTGSNIKNIDLSGCQKLKEVWGCNGAREVLTNHGVIRHE